LWPRKPPPPTGLKHCPIESATTPSSAGSTAANASTSATTTCDNIYARNITKYRNTQQQLVHRRYQVHYTLPTNRNQPSPLNSKSPTKTPASAGCYTRVPERLSCFGFRSFF